MDLIQNDNNEDINCPSSSHHGDAFENLEVLPRIGDMYQAQTPLIIEDYVKSTSSLLPNLPIPIMWAQVDFDNSSKKVPDANVALAKRMNNKAKGCYPFPGSLGKSWGEHERDSFVLGLYIFGKNMLHVTTFVESKDMGDVLSFYYGEFYRSDRYYKWSQFLKRRIARSHHQIFSAGKLQEILSRLAPHLSEKCRNELLENSRTFEEGNVPLEEYVFALKKAVGMDKLIDAVGIGRGKLDLTVTSVQSTIKKNISSIRRKTAFIKACSYLSNEDIIKCLRGDSCLSKARSNDLFWEAVWPRLLVKGWHSEHRNKHGDSGLKDHLVFLVPGIKKFNRRRLVKGEDYFDTSNDVLSKVALNPLLLEPTSKTAEDRREREEKNPDSDPDEMKFTIVDTSLFDGKKRCKVKVLRKALVIDTENGFSQCNHSNENEPNSSKKLAEGQGNASGDSNLQETSANSSECVTGSMESPSSRLGKDDQSTESNKYDVSQMVKCGDSSSIASALDESSHQPKTMSLNSMMNKENLHCQSNSLYSRQIVVCPVDSSHHIPKACSSAKKKAEGTNETSPQAKPLKLSVKGPRQIQQLQPPIENERRQSTRNRPLTTKALEAIESGFLVAPKKRKITESIPKKSLLC